MNKMCIRDRGGVSFSACIGAFILLMLVGSLCSMLLGPDLNALAVSDKLEQLGVPTEVFTSITMQQVAQMCIRDRPL